MEYIIIYVHVEDLFTSISLWFGKVSNNIKSNKLTSWICQTVIVSEPERSIFRCKFSSLKVVADGYISDHSGFSQTQGAILMPQLGGSVKSWNQATIFRDFIILVRMVTIAAAHIERYMESWAYFQVAGSLDEMAGGSGNSTYWTSNLQKMERIQRFKCGRSTHLSHVVKWKFFDLLISVVILLMGCKLFRCCDCLHTIQKDLYLLVDIICAVVKWRFDYWILKLLWLISNDYWDFLCKSKLLQYCCEVEHATLKALLLARF